MTKPDGLRELEKALARDFAFLNAPPAEWVPPKHDTNGNRVLDALIVGGGMCGVTAAFHFRRLGIHNIRIIDAAPAERVGPWLTFARMETLRSPKHLTGPASGMANLTFRAWFEARFGTEAWQPLGNIPREMWADYMVWFTRATGAGVEHGCALERLAGQGGSWRAELHHRESNRQEHVESRHVVLATGREGLAVPRIPPPFDQFHGNGVVHTGEAPPRDLMAGRDVCVIGLGASAFDYAAEALEAGARRVTIMGRSSRLSRVNKAKQIVYAGFVHGYPLLPDAEKLAILEHIFQHGVAPPRGTVQRVMRHDNVDLVLAAPVQSITARDGRLNLQTPKGVLPADLVILGTGYRIDTGAAPFMQNVSKHIKLWRDAVPGSKASSEFLDFPYLGEAFQFAPRQISGVDVRSLSRLHCFNHAAMLSLGNLANDIPAVSEGADRLARAVAADLYLEDREVHLANLHAYEDPELEGNEVPGLQQWWPDL